VTEDQGSDSRVLAGRYELAESISSGSRASVWRAYDLDLGRQVAIKVIHPHVADDSAILERFRLEAKSAKALSSPNIVAAYDWVVGPPATYKVMELVEGPSLRDRLLGEGRLSVPATVDLIAQVLAGLGLAHDSGIVHGDVKPEHILFAPLGDGRETAKLIDFGFVTSGHGEQCLQRGGFDGTPAYCAPELSGGGPFTPTSDVYAVGCVTYECLAGQPPFAGEPMAVALQHQNRRFPSITKLRSDVPSALSSVIATATEKDPTLRFASARPMSSAIRHIADAESLAIGPWPAGAGAGADPNLDSVEDEQSRSATQWRRRLVPAVAAAIIIVGLGIGIGIHVASSRPGVAVAVPPSQVLGVRPTVTQIAYQDGTGDIHVFDTATGVDRALTTDGAGVGYSEVAFRSASSISFVSANAGNADVSTLFLLDERTGKRTTVYSSDTSIDDAEWSPDATRVAILVSGALLIHDMASDTTSTVLTLPPENQVDRNIASDEASVFWSPNGTMICVVDTYVVPPARPTMWVIRPDGAPVVSSRDGTEPVWSKDSSTIYYRPFSAGDQWLALSLAHDTESVLANLRADAYFPILSPDGTELAYSDAAPTSSVYTYDLRTQTETRVARGFTYPTWLSSNGLLVVMSRPCSTACPEAWTTVGAARVLNTETGQQAPTPIRSMDTLQGDDSWPD
jgi:serine/threonine-protein kinase